MTVDAVHPRVLGYLGRALSLELTAVQQTMTQAGLLERWGLSAAADRLRHATVAELRQADALVQRMLALGVAPASSQLRPAAHGPDLAGLLHQNLLLEDDLVNLYAEAVRFCLWIGDAASEQLFRQLWIEAQAHADQLTAWLDSLPHAPAGLANPSHL